MQLQDQRGLERTADVSVKMSTVSSDDAVQKHVSFSDVVQLCIHLQPRHTCHPVHCHSLHMHFHPVLCNSLRRPLNPLPQLPQQKADRPQALRELKIPLCPNLNLVSFGRAMQKRVTQWLLAQNEDLPDPMPKRRGHRQKSFCKPGVA